MTANKTKILVIDDDLRLRELLLRYLAEQGFEVGAEPSGAGLDKRLERSRPDLMVLDLMLPGGEDGLAICRRLRGAGEDIPIIMLTAKGDEIDRVIGLEMGADDYLPKPFGGRELVARIRAVLRRNRAREPATAQDKPKRYRFERWTFDADRRELLGDDGVAMPLSTGEFDLLLALVEHPQRTLSRDQLLDLARHRAANSFDRSMDTQVSRLRKKIERDPSEPALIKTVWGGGYIFTPDVSRE